MKRLIPIIGLFSIIIALNAVCSAQTLREYNVFLRSNIGSDTLWDGNIIRIFGMATRLSAQPTLPAATLYCNEGDTLVLNALSISQGDHHSIHLHGMDADTRNDGDPATSFSLGHMKDTTYSVVADHAGTYIYHCHVTDVIHVQMGMYGLIIVRPKDGGQTAWTDGPHYDKTMAWLTSEIDRSWHDNIPKHDTIADTIHVPPYKPSYFLINGKSESQLRQDSAIRIDAGSGSEVYVRLANIGFFQNRIIFPHSAGAQIIASDGRPLPAVIQSDTIECSPGERYGVMLTLQGEVNDSVRIEYVNMNTDSIWSSQYVPLHSTIAKVSETKQDIEEIRVIPNPAHDQIFVSGIEQNCSFEILDCIGRLVQSGKAANGIIDIRKISKGVYFIRVGARSCRFIVN